MKLLSVIFSNPDYYPPVVNSSRLLSRAGHEHTILSRLYQLPTGVKYPTDLNIIRVEPTSRNSFLEFLGFIRLAMSSVEHKADVYIGHDMHGFLVARLLAWRNRRPVIYHCHDFTDVPGSIGASAVSRFERWFARTADLVIVPDADRAKVVAKALGLKTPPVVVANAPLHVPDWSEGLLKITLQEMGYSFEKVVLRQGRIDQGHCIDVTIRSMPFWKNPKWGFVIFGQTNEEYKQYLLRMSLELGVQDRFVILPTVRYSDVLKYTIEADLGHAMYVPSNLSHRLSNMASNKLMEYMACGIPVLLGKRDHHLEFLDQYSVGLTADIESPEEIADAVNCLLCDPEVAAQMRVAGRQAFNDYFRYDLQYRPVLEYLNKQEASRQ